MDVTVICPRCNRRCYTYYDFASGDQRYGTHDIDPLLRSICPHSGETVDYSILFATE